MIQKRILIIDDDETICSTLSAVLEGEGYCVDSAENGQKAIKLTRKNNYNLALIDWRLPDFEGTTLILKIIEATPTIMSIMVTGYPSMNNAIDAVNNQFDAFLVKPVDFEVLLKKISELLKKQEELQTFTEDRMVNFIKIRTKEIIQTKTPQC